MCSIDWSVFNWEALATFSGAVATFFVGMAAVRGAEKVGLKQLEVTQKQTEIAARQTDIANRQADILDHQVEVERAGLRAQLFEPRMAVYKACQAYLHDAIGSGLDEDASAAVSEELGKQLEQARFLFAGSVREQLIKIAEEADTLSDERETLVNLRDFHRGKHPELEDQIKHVRVLRTALREKLSGLADDMGEEMRLYIPKKAKRARSVGEIMRSISN